MTALAWRKLLVTSKYLHRIIRYGVRNLPSVPFSRGEILPKILQTRADLPFARRNLQNGLKDRFYEEITDIHVRDQVARGRLVSSAIVVWKGEGEQRKGLYVINIRKQSKQ